MSLTPGLRCGVAQARFPAHLHAIIRAIDGSPDVTGKLISLTMLFLVVTITYEVVMRYCFNAPTVWVYELSTMANGSAFMLGCAYALYKGAHVRTDIYWENFSERTKGIIDIDLVHPSVLPGHDHLHGDQHRCCDPLLVNRRAVAGKRVARDHVAVPRHHPAFGRSPHDPGRLRSPEVLVPDPVRARVRAQEKIEDMTGLELLGLFDAAGDAGGDLHRSADQLHAVVSRGCVRLHRHRVRGCSASPTCRPSAS